MGRTGIMIRALWQKLTLVLAAGMLMTAIAPPSWAAGFYLQEQSATAMGTAYAGAGVQARDASVLYYNPAAMVALDSRQISVNADVIFSQSNTTDLGSRVLGGPAGGPDISDAIPTSFLANSYIAYPFMDGDLWLGAGLSTPFGLRTQYSSDWFGRFDSTESHLETYNIQPSFAYRITDWLAFGGGLDVQYADAELVKRVTNGATEGQSKLLGTDWSFGYNAGLYVDATDRTRLGLHYRSKMFHQLDGRIVVEGVAGLNENVGGTAKLTLPEIVGLSVAHEMQDGWTLLGQFNWFGWDSFNKIQPVRDDGSIVETTELNYDPSASLAIGLEYEWDDHLTLQGGYQFDRTPTDDDLRTTAIPDGSRHNFTVGAIYELNDSFTLAASGMAGFMQSADINVSRNNGLAPVRVRREDAMFQILSVGLSYKF